LTFFRNSLIPNPGDFFALKSGFLALISDFCAKKAAFQHKKSPGLEASGYSWIFYFLFLFVEFVTNEIILHIDFLESPFISYLMKIWDFPENYCTLDLQGPSKKNTPKIEVIKRTPIQWLDVIFRTSIWGNLFYDQKLYIIFFSVYDMTEIW